MTHTPGPWRMHDGMLIGDNNIIVCDPYGPNPQDAALIAAAPDLLRACEMLLDRTANPITDHAFYTLEDARVEAFAVIQRATENGH